jgi:phycobilisome rod-core linker protein
MLPLLTISPTTQNHRVPGYEVPDEDDAMVYRLTDTSDNEQIDALIWAAYRQIFSEHLILESYRQRFLESQLRNRAIAVSDFIRGLGTSEVFRRLVRDTNSNYRFVEICCTRFLGRSTYGKDEQIANSIILATQGLNGFIDSLINSDEYRTNFGTDIVPYQRRRMGDRPFNLVTPRYSDYWRAKEATAFSSGAGLALRRNLTAQTLRVRSGIPPMFLSMAAALSPAQVNYQYTLARAASPKQLPLPDMSSNASYATVGRRESSTPYRYLPN